MTDPLAQVFGAQPPEVKFHKRHLPTADAEINDIFSSIFSDEPKDKRQGSLIGTALALPDIDTIDPTDPNRLKNLSAPGIPTRLPGLAKDLTYIGAVGLADMAISFGAGIMGLGLAVTEMTPKEAWNTLTSPTWITEAPPEMKENLMDALPGFIGDDLASGIADLGVDVNRLASEGMARGLAGLGTVLGANFTNLPGIRGKKPWGTRSSDYIKLTEDSFNYMLDKEAEFAAQFASQEVGMTIGMAPVIVANAVSPGTIARGLGLAAGVTIAGGVAGTYGAIRAGRATKAFAKSHLDLLRRGGRIKNPGVSIGEAFIPPQMTDDAIRAVEVAARDSKPTTKSMREAAARIYEGLPENKAAQRFAQDMEVHFLAEQIAVDKAVRGAEKSLGIRPLEDLMRWFEGEDLGQGMHNLLYGGDFQRSLQNHIFGGPIYDDVESGFVSAGGGFRSLMDRLVKKHEYDEALKRIEELRRNETDPVQRRALERRFHELSSTREMELNRKFLADIIHQKKYSKLLDEGDIVLDPSKSDLHRQLTKEINDHLDVAYDRAMRDIQGAVEKEGLYTFPRQDFELQFNRQVLQDEVTNFLDILNHHQKKAKAAEEWLVGARKNFAAELTKEVGEMRASRVLGDDYGPVIKGLEETIGRLGSERGRVSYLPDLDPALKWGDDVSVDQYIHNWARIMEAEPRVAFALIEQERRAIIEAFPDVNLRELGHALVEETGDIRKILSGEPSTYAQVMNEVRGNPHLYLFHKFLTRKQEFFKAMYKIENDLLSIMNEKLPSQVEGAYLSHSWEGLDWASPAVPRPGNPQKTMQGVISSSVWHADDVLKRGDKVEVKIPKSFDIADQLAVTQQRMVSLIQTKKIFDDLLHKNMTPEGDPVFLRAGELSDDLYEGQTQSAVKTLNRATKSPENYIEISPNITPELRSLLEINVPGQGGKIYVDKRVWKHVQGILKAKSTNKLVTALDDFAYFTKRANFMFSMFHGLSLTESAVNIMGLKGFRLSAALGGGMPFFGEALSRLAGGETYVQRYLGPRNMVEAEARAVGYLTGVDPPRLDINIDRISGITAGWKQSASASLRGVGKVADAFYAAQKYWDEALWEKLHHPLKVIMFNKLYDDLLAVKHGQSKMTYGGKWGKKRLAKMTDDDIGFEVAQFVNDEFGGQNWTELSKRMGIEMVASPNFLLGLRIGMISADWNASAVRAGTAFLGLLPESKVLSKVTSKFPDSVIARRVQKVEDVYNRFADNPVRGILGTRHWVNAATSLYITANLVNWATTKAVDGKGKFIHQNSPGRDRTHIFAGRRRDGRPIYFTVGKQFRELPHLFGATHNGELSKHIGWLGAPVQFVLGKTNPVLQRLANPVMSPTGFETESLRAMMEAHKQAKELGGTKRTINWLTDLASTVLPFQVQTALRQKTAGTRALAVAVPLPMSMGPGAYEYQIKLTKAYRAGDFEETLRLYQHMMDDNIHPQDMVKAIKAAKRTALKYPEEGVIEDVETERERRDRILYGID